MDPTSLRLTGAVPLDSFAASRAAAAAGPMSTSPFVVDVTEATFEQEVVRRSTQVPVVIDFWAAWCGPCKQLSPILEKLAEGGGGSWVLAKIDVDANPRLAQAAAVQGIPAVKAVVGGQVVGEFTGAMPESQVRQWIDRLVEAAASGAYGQLTGRSDGGDTGPAEPEVDADLAAGDDNLVAGDLDASEAAYQRLLDRAGVTPQLRAEARGGLARVALLRRTESLDPQAVRAAAEAAPDDVAAVIAYSDLLVLSEQAEHALEILLRFVRNSSGDDRDAARQHLLALFDVLGDTDPLVPAARRKLASALF